jgi:hypothetical protein
MKNDPLHFIDLLLLIFQLLILLTRSSASNSSEHFTKLFPIDFFHLDFFCGYEKEEEKLFM